MKNTHQSEIPLDFNEVSYMYELNEYEYIDKPYVPYNKLSDNKRIVISDFLHTYIPQISPTMHSKLIEELYKYNPYGISRKDVMKRYRSILGCVIVCNDDIVRKLYQEINDY